MSHMAKIGRPAFRPTGPQRRDVQLLKAQGWGERRIADQLRIARNTLTKHFAAELKHGADAMELSMLHALLREANKGSVPAIREMLRRIEAVRRPHGIIRPPKLGKKEIAHQEALHAHEDSDWGDVLKPLEERIN